MSRSSGRARSIRAEAAMRIAYRVLLLAAALLVARESAAGPGGGSLLGTNRSNQLFRVSTLTGAPTLIGPMGAGPMPGLAVDVVTGAIYAGQGQGTPNVYTLNPLTGAATL